MAVITGRLRMFEGQRQEKEKGNYTSCRWRGISAQKVPSVCNSPSAEVAKIQTELIRGQCLFRSVRTNQSEQTGLFGPYNALKGAVRHRVKRGDAV